MAKAFIVVGDRTDHGGTVITGDPTTNIHGRLLARVGDMTVCPRCKGTFPIQSGSGNMIAMEQAPARHGDTTGCGARLIASQGTTTIATWAPVGTPTTAQTAALAATSPQVASAAPALCLECLQKAAAAASAFIVRA